MCESLEPISDFGSHLLKKKASEEGGVTCKLVDLETTSHCAYSTCITFVPCCVSFLISMNEFYDISYPRLELCEYGVLRIVLVVLSCILGLVDS